MAANKKIHVGLIFGGRSGEHEVSLASAMSVYKALDKSRYDVTMIGIDKDGRWLMPDVQNLLAQAENPMLVKLSKTSGEFGLIPYPRQQQLISLNPGQMGPGAIDVILPILHGTYGEDGTIQGLFELAQIPYVGSGVLGSAVGMDKDVAGRLFEQAGIKTVPTIVIRKSDWKKSPERIRDRLQSEFGYPFFVKPANAGSSVGVHKVKGPRDIEAALKDAFAFDLKVLVQKGVAARELEVAVLGNENPKASIVGEIVPKREFYSYEAKYIDENGAELKIPADNVPEDTLKKVQDWAVQAFQVLDLRGMARVDFFLDRDTGELFLNEVNTIPGFTKISMYPKLWEASGLPYSKLLDELIRLALEHHAEKRELKTEY
ncbi:MAG: D-alanine--D-alanine ligase [Bdellovibrionales bacterium]